jgi:RNA polymerase sigma-70 factor (ECF subfamily)
MPESTNTTIGEGAGQSERSLESLMEAYQQGDASAGDQLFTRVSQQLYRFMAVQSGDRRFADDLLQDLWLRIHKARPTYRAGEPVLPWLYAIARFVKVDGYRKRRAASFEEPLPPGFEPRAEVPGRAADLPEIDYLLKDLPESQREVILMLKVSGLSLEEVAKATGSSVGSVKQKAHRAYEKLRATLREFRPREGGRQ